MYDHHVLIKEILPSIASVAQLTEMFVIPGVIPHVTPQVGFMCKHFGAENAGKFIINLKK